MLMNEEPGKAGAFCIAVADFGARLLMNLYLGLLAKNRKRWISLEKAAPKIGSRKGRNEERD